MESRQAHHNHRFSTVRENQSNGHPKYNAKPQPCLALFNSNHCTDTTCDRLPVHSPYNVSTHELSPLYYHPMNIYYGPYLVETDVSDFITVAYQAAIILRLSTNPRMGWYARNMSELQSPNRTIRFTGLTRILITHQTTSWTQ